MSDQIVVTKKMEKAIEIFQKYGWDQVTLDNGMDLELGTKEEQKIVLSVLKEGGYGKWVRSDNKMHYQTVFNIHSLFLSIYEIRAGISARRTANNITLEYNQLVIDAIASRGSKFALDFIDFACRDDRRPWEHTISVFGPIAVKLVRQMNLPIPESSEYIKDWVFDCAIALGIDVYAKERVKEPSTIAQISDRFINHFEIAVTTNTPATGPLGEVIPAAVKAGIVDQSLAIDYSFTALTNAIRPGDRKAWAAVIEQIEAPDQYLTSKVESLIPIFATGDTQVITKFGPLLIKNADDKYVLELVTSCIGVKTKKGKQLVMRAAAERKAPEDAHQIIPWLAVILDGSDKALIKDANNLIKAWNLNYQNNPEQKSQVVGLWQSPPPLWTLPDFTVGEISQVNLTELLSTIIKRREQPTDCITEQFIAVANSLAAIDSNECRVAFSGLTASNQAACSETMNAYLWVHVPEKLSNVRLDARGRPKYDVVLSARTAAIFANLGKIPNILSMPSKLDMTVSLDDLITRVSAYQKLKLAVLEPDLQLALTRLDLKTVTKPSLQKLNSLDVPIILQSNEHLEVNAGQAIANYIANPITLEYFDKEYGDRFTDQKLIAKSFSGFPDRFYRLYIADRHAVFPTFPNLGLPYMGIYRGDANHGDGLLLKQLVNQGQPVDSETAIKLFYAQIKPNSRYAEADMFAALILAWERGLLLPGVADVNCILDTEQKITALASLANVLDEAINLQMLAVVWPILDDIINKSITAPRLFAGTAEICQLIVKYLPEVRAAVDSGAADKSALDLHATRELASRSGTSKAVVFAKEAVANLPQLTENPEINVQKPPIDFDSAWLTYENTYPLVEDNAMIDISISSDKKHFIYTLTLPNGQKYYIEKQGWFYDLEREHQCQARTSLDISLGDTQNLSWLSWEAKASLITVSKYRNRTEQVHGPATAVDKSVNMPISLLTVCVGILAQDGDSTYYGTQTVTGLIKKGCITAEIVERATTTLLTCPELSPAKLARILEKKPEYLSVLYPILIESIKHGAHLAKENAKVPVWVSRIIDIITRNLDILVLAEQRSKLDLTEVKSALETIRQIKAKSVSVTKAAKLLSLISN